jgi:ribosomal protein L40E
MNRRPRMVNGKRQPKVDGYVTVQKNGRVYKEHRLVWMETHGEIPPTYQVHHINGIRSDNRLENLECLSPEEHKRRHSGCFVAENGIEQKPCRSCKQTKPLDVENWRRVKGYWDFRCRQCHAKSARDKYHEKKSSLRAPISPIPLTVNHEPRNPKLWKKIFPQWLWNLMKSLVNALKLNY